MTLSRLSILLLLFEATSLLPAEDEPPLLIIESQGPSAAIRKLIFDTDMNELISLGDDKAIRFWDIETGELRRTLRGHIGEGLEGALFAGAISPDGLWLAVGGYESTIHIIDLITEEVAAVLRGHTDTISGLSFSDDGLSLASASTDNNVRVWNLEELGVDESLLEITESQILEGHTNMVQTVDFAAGGRRLISGGDDNTVILWKREGPDEDFEADVVLEGHTDTVSCAKFSPDGSIIVTGSFDHQLLMWDGESGEFIEALDEDMGAEINTLSFSPGGDQLLAASQAGGTGNTAIYDIASGEQLVTFPLHDNNVLASAWHAELNLVATGGGSNDEIYLWYPAADTEAGTDAGAVKHCILGWGVTGWSVAFSEVDDLVVAFGQTRDPEKEMLENDLEQVFDFKIFDLVDGGTYRQTLTELDGSVLELFDTETLKVGEAGVISNDETDGSLLSFSFTPDGKNIVVGSEYTLSSFESEPDDEGTFNVTTDFIGHESAVNALSPSLDGEYLATTSGDKTLRLWNLQTGALLASLFVSYDREWVCWTPSGHYQASSGGEQYIGWHFNKGPDKMGEFFPSSVFRDAFHHPELVKRTILLGDFEQALTEVGADPVDIASLVPPEIDWVLPDGKSVTQSENEFSVHAEISSPNGELRKLKLLLNGKAIRTHTLTGENDFSYEETVTLNPGENRLSLFVRNEHAGQTSEERIINVAEVGLDTASPDTVAPGLEELLKPTLYMLSVGVSEFASADIPALDFCDDDATAMAEFFAKQEGGLFAKAEVRLLINGDATEAKILEGLDWLEKSATQKDFVILFLAAHGMNDEKGNFYMIPHDCDLDSLRSTGVAWEDFGATLGNLPSRTLMFLDTCHSGRLGANLFSMAKGDTGQKTRSIGGLKSAFDNTEAIRELTSDEVGVVIMAASTGNEFSVENAEWGHGAFTAGVLAGLGGEADLNGDGTVHLLELDFFVSERVKELSKGAQHPTTVKPSTISRLPISTVME